MADICFPSTWAPKGLSYFTAIASLLLSIIIISGNLLILVAFIKDPFKRLRTPFSFFLLNLTASDLIVGIIIMPISVIVHFSEATGTLGKSKILAIHLSYFISTNASVLGLGILCFDRYLAIKNPLHHRKHLHLRKCIMISAILWTVAISASMLYFYTGYVTLLMICTHTSVAATLSILLITYVSVYRILKHLSGELGDSNGQSVNCKGNGMSTRALREKKVTWAFLSILLTFICSYAPAVIMIYILQFCQSCSCELRHALRDLQFLIISANSASNPIVCALRMEPFRKAIKSIIRCPVRSKNKLDLTSDAANDVMELKTSQIFLVAYQSSIMLQSNNGNGGLDTTTMSSKLTSL